MGNVVIRALKNKTNFETVNNYCPAVTDAQRAKMIWQYHLFGAPALKTEHFENTDNGCGKAD
ncbi:MAG: hypothetical protein CSB55_04305 [Candidatus Cloacimonadota bacterium]|nr:MAG: hypothetical protein CSB55_04305 [Candidatus Cloacimonadota bacterium]